MTSEAGFRQDIASDPTNDSLRLVYADWLQEHDQPDFAEFIRLQCELTEEDPAHEVSWDRVARRGTISDARVRHALDLFVRNELRWAGTDPFKISFSIRHTAIWRRGLIEELTCPTQHWLTYAEQLLQWHPVQKAHLTTWPMILREDDPDSTDHQIVRFLGSEESVQMKTDAEEGVCLEALLSLQWPNVELELPPEQESDV